MIKHPINRFFCWIKGSFDVSEIGASAKKLSSFIAVTITVYLELKFVSLDTLVEVVIINFTFAASLLGISTLDKVNARKIDADNKHTDVS